MSRRLAQGNPDDRDWSEVVQDLARLTMPDCVIWDAESLRPYECDGLSAYRVLPRCVVLPESEAQASRVLRYCHMASIPVVTRGAGTGLSAGATPHAEGIVLSMAKFDRIVEIDPEGGLARVEPGVRNAAISEAAAAHGLFYAPDPSSQIACSIGGNLAENAGGVHCLKYGLTVHNVIGLRMLTADGETIEIGGSGLDAPGPDLLAVMAGSEGLLAVVTELTVRLVPMPESCRVIVAGFRSVGEAGDAVAAIIAAGVVPAGLEMMDGLAIRAAESFAHAGYPVDAEALLLCEIDGMREEVDTRIDELERMLQVLGAFEVRSSTDEAERALLWKGRKSAFPAVGRLAPDYYCMDGTIPRGELAPVLTGIAGLAKEYGLRVANVFHAGDGNLHPLILYDANRPGELEQAEALGARILELCVDAGGCITGEHGVGLEKLRQVQLQFNEDELTQLGLVKFAFDPEGILNPGKGFPLLARCQEYRVLAQPAGDS